MLNACSSVAVNHTAERKPHSKAPETIIFPIEVTCESQAPGILEGKCMSVIRIEEAFIISTLRSKYWFKFGSIKTSD